jgi:choline dehydrogenase
MATTIGCDVAVVGGGSSGCVVAGRMAAESEAEVVLIEAGPDYGARGSGAWPADLLDGGALVTSHDWGYASGELPGRLPIGFPRARVIGGCSSHNGCVAAVGCPEDYDRWAALTGDGRWDSAAIRPALDRVLGRMRVRVYREDEVGPLHRACLDAATAAGWPRADDLADLDGGLGFGIEPVNVEDGVRVNAAFAYVDPARGRPNLTILANALCDRVDVGAGGPTVVAWREGEEVRIEARVVVLSAGAYGSPAVLQRSGVGDPSALRATGIAPSLEHPGVGLGLHDHPLVELEFEGSERLRELQRAASAEQFTPEEQTLGKLRSSLAEGPYDLHVYPVAAHEHSLLAGRVLLVAAALEPRSRGRLRVVSADPDAAPAIDHGYLSDAGGLDVAVLAEGVELARALAATEPLRSLVGDELPTTRDAALERFHAHYFHPVGTCAMGTDAMSVCDGAGRVRGLDGVVVADCSLMPVIPRANTNIPAVLVGEVIADSLLA